jgi:hypothetical protein
MPIQTATQTATNYTPDELVFFEAYLECALWLATDEDGEPLDKGGWSADHFSLESLSRCARDCRAFLESADEFIGYSELTSAEAGHLFWLSRNGHGSGFWDRGEHPVFAELHATAKRCGEAHVYIGDDSRLHVFAG